MADGTNQAVTAKEEIGEFCVSTRFGKGKKIKRDVPIARPTSREEAVAQIEELYRFNRWNDSDRAANSLSVGLEPKPTGDYTNYELRVILTDAEKRGMILYRN
jgi:hypothetical protein